MTLHPLENRLMRLANAHLALNRDDVEQPFQPQHLQFASLLVGGTVGDDKQRVARLQRVQHLQRLLVQVEHLLAQGGVLLADALRQPVGVYVQARQEAAEGLRARRAPLPQIERIPPLRVQFSSTLWNARL
jgi:hypothetical protein